MSAYTARITAETAVHPSDQTLQLIADGVRPGTLPPDYKDRGVHRLHLPLVPTSESLITRRFAHRDGCCGPGQVMRYSRLRALGRGHVNDSRTQRCPDPS
jgi:hypothetical protein